MVPGGLSTGFKEADWEKGALGLANTNGRIQGWQLSSDDWVVWLCGFVAFDPEHFFLAPPRHWASNSHIGCAEGFFVNF